MSKKKLDKPRKKTREYLDYNECRDFICNKYKIEDELWNWLVDNQSIYNGCTFSIYYDNLELCKNTKACDFMRKLFEEFGPEDSKIEFEVSW